MAIQAVLSRVSKFGFQTEADGDKKWFNLSKYEKVLKMDGLKKGDSVEYTLDSKGYLASASKSGSGASSSPAQSSGQSHSTQSGSQNESIARAVALKAAFGEPLRLLASAEGVPVEDALDRAEDLTKRMVRYLIIGSFDEPEEPQQEAK